MNKTVSSRNLIGGFLGGTLGILASWYLNPMVLPLGVLLGVVVGWWNEDIAQMSVQCSRFALRLWEALKMRVVPDEIRLPHLAFLKRFKMLIGICTTKVRTGVAHFFEYAIMPLHWLAAGIRVLARISVQVVRWASHPSSIALLITIGAIMVGAVINAIAFATIWPWPETTTIGGSMSNKPVEVIPFPFKDVVMITGLVTMLLTMFGAMSIIAEGTEGNPVQNFYARWERYSQYSPVTYFARELFRFFKSEVAIAALVALTLVYWVTLGGALFALVVVPVATFVTFMVGLYKIAQRSAHWWCFGITLVTTSISALIFYDNFGNDIVLWTIALCTGLASGGVTEGMRRVGLWWSSTATGQHYLNIWHDDEKMLLFSIATPAWKTLMRAFDNVGDRTIRIAR